MSPSQIAEKIREELSLSPVYAMRIAHEVDPEQDVVEQARKRIADRAQPFVKWVGGKRQLLKQFRQMYLYPPKGFVSEKQRYFEPFVGGGAVFFDLHPQHATLSDLNSDLITTYKVIRDDVESLIVSLRKHKYEKDYYLKVRARKHERDIDIASRFIFLNRTCFNGMYRVNSSGEFNVPFGKYTNPQICDAVNLRRVSKALKGVTLLNTGYEHVLKKAKKGDFVYFDPPYHPVNATSSFTSYTSDGFGASDQKRLRDVFVELSKRGCYVMLSNSDTPFINQLYTLPKSLGIKIHKVQAGRSVNSKSSKRGKISEVLVVNY
jgi:DNA adenine methylase